MRAHIVTHMDVHTNMLRQSLHTHARMYTHTYTCTHNTQTKTKPSAAVLAQSRLPSGPVIGHCALLRCHESAQENTPPGTGLVTGRGCIMSHR